MEIRRLAHRLRTKPKLILPSIRQRLHQWIVKTTGPRIIQVDLGDFSMLVREHEDVGSYIAANRAFEPVDSVALSKLVCDGDVCIDVGANTGYYSFLLRTACGGSGSVHAFEPIGLNVLLLRAGILMNGFVNVFVQECCLGDRSHTTTFSMATDSAFSSMRSTGRSQEGRLVDVLVTTLDDYAKSARLTSIGVIKIDVEGAEELVLRGALSTFAIRSLRPRAMMIELFSPNLQAYGSSIEKIVDLLMEYSYKPFVATNEGFRAFQRDDWDLEPNVFFLQPDTSLTR